MSNCSFFISLLILSLISFVRASTCASCPGTITVNGQGSITSVPDTASINTGVVTLAKTAQAALTRNNRLFRGILTTLSQFGVEQRDIQTSSFSVSPRFERNENRGTRRIIGYTVRNNLDVIVRDLSQLGMILDALVKVGSNTISRVRFLISDDSALRDQARKLAVRDGVRRATLLAEEAGATLGKVVDIQEGVSFPDIPQPEAFRQVPLREVPIAAGEQDVVASVSLKFELVNKMRQLPS